MALLATRFGERISPAEFQQNPTKCFGRWYQDISGQMGGGVSYKASLFLLRKECLILHLYQYVQVHINKDTSEDSSLQGCYTVSTGKLPEVSKDCNAFIFRVK